jgi:hypothetical protein
LKEEGRLQRTIFPANWLPVEKATVAIDVAATDGCYQGCAEDGTKKEPTLARSQSREGS